MRFVFRADASSTIGFGHLSRAAALAGAASRAGASVELVTCRPDPGVRAVAVRAEMTVHAIHVNPGTPEDASATRAIAGRGGLVVVDGYAFGAHYLEELGGDERIVMYVDDLARERLACDVILNPNVSAHAADYQTAPETVLLLGPSFAIVHDRFVEARRVRSASRPVEPPVAHRLLVTMGGSDPPGATLHTIEALSSTIGASMEVRVVVGSANQRVSELQRAARACTRHRVELRMAVEDMAAEMLWADLAVTASGVTATELACVGVAGVSFAIVDNQEPIATHLARLHMFDVLPPGGGGPAAIALALSRLATDGIRRSRMVDAQRSTIDGSGKDRVVARLLALPPGEGHTRDHGGGERD
jgi:UDP-2,4-diacetamido-2,4,6-trideoxy-beta-L-altropyranose hydrolase